MSTPTVTRQFTRALALQPESVQKLVRRIVDQLAPDSIILFGSRARETHRENSDFDLACKFRKRDTLAWTKFLVNLKEEPWTLWSVDLVDYSELSADYRENIDREGQLLYGKN